MAGAMRSACMQVLFVVTTATFAQRMHHIMTQNAWPACRAVQAKAAAGFEAARKRFSDTQVAAALPVPAGPRAGGPGGAEALDDMGMNVDDSDGGPAAGRVPTPAASVVVITDSDEEDGDVSAAADKPAEPIMATRSRSEFGGTGIR